MANITGWGRSTWGSGEWGEAIPVTLTGLAATSALGSLAVDAEANVTPASQVGNSALGTATTVSNNNISVTGLSATSAVGSLTVDAEANITPAGQSATSALGTATTVSNNNISVSGLVATSAIGGVGVNGQAVASLPGVVSTLGSVSVDVDGEANVTVTGVAGISAIGTSSTITDNRFEAPGFANLRASDPFVNPTVNAACNFTIIGVSATGELGHIFKWQDIDESQTPNWTDVAA